MPESMDARRFNPERGDAELREASRGAVDRPSELVIELRFVQVHSNSRPEVAFLLCNNTFATTQRATVYDSIGAQVTGIKELLVPADDTVFVVFHEWLDDYTNHAIHVAVVIGEVLGYQPESIFLDLDYDPEDVIFSVADHWPYIKRQLELDRSQG